MSVQLADQLEQDTERCDRCGDDRNRGAGWDHFCGHCAEAYDNGADDDWDEPKKLRAA